MTDYIVIMREMFEKNITDKSKKFDASYVKNESSGNSGAFAWGYYMSSPVIKITYNGNGVKMKYYSRFTHHLGDSDTFVDRYVECNESVLLDEKYGF